MRTRTNCSTGRVLDGPHAGRILHGLGGNAPTAICLLDADWCYHEYRRVEPVGGEHRYAYLGRLGRPRWAEVVYPLLCATLAKGFCAAAVDGYCIGGTHDGRCHG